MNQIIFLFLKETIRKITFCKSNIGAKSPSHWRIGTIHPFVFDGSFD